MPFSPLHFILCNICDEYWKGIKKLNMKKATKMVYPLQKRHCNLQNAYKSKTPFYALKSTCLTTFVSYSILRYTFTSSIQFILLATPYKYPVHHLCLGRLPQPCTIYPIWIVHTAQFVSYNNWSGFLSSWELVFLVKCVKLSLKKIREQFFINIFLISIVIHTNYCMYWYTLTVFIALEILGHEGIV